MLDLSSATFSFYLSANKNPLFARHIQLNQARYWLSISNKTNVLHEVHGDTEVVVIGLCVDAYGEYESDEVAQVIAALPKALISDHYRFCDRFAGKYCVLYFQNNEGYLWGDATGSLQTAYFMHDGGVTVSNFPELIVQEHKLTRSPSKECILRGSDASQPMPYDITVYDGLRVLLPNHILCLNTGKPYRGSLSIKEVSRQEIEGVCERTYRLISRILKEYLKKYQIICPLTSGYDSRTNLSFLQKQTEDVFCYTFWHNSFTDDTPDIAVPRRICERLGYSYQTIRDKSAPEEIKTYLQLYSGDDYNDFNANLAFTYSSCFQDKAFLNGDIIDQVGKSLLGHAIPWWFATPFFFRCKLHNRSRMTNKVIAQHISDMQAAGERQLVFDLFAVENRCSRWAAQSDIVLCLTGITSLNIYNCREVLREWISIPRKHRINYLLHKYYLKKNEMELSDIPFHSGGLVAVLKKHWFLFYCATVGKHWIGR